MPTKKPKGPPKAAPQTANEAYRDAALRHAIGLRRYTAGISKRVAALLEKADAELTTLLRARLGDFAGKPVDFTSARYKALLDDIRAARSAVLGQVRDLSRDEMNQLVKLEADREKALLEAAIPIEVNLVSVALDKLRTIVTSRPFHGKLLKDWYSDLEAVDRKRLVQGIQIGLTTGETVDDMVRRIVGTRANQYTDGILSITRRDAQTIVRTAVNHVSNEAREALWEDNSDIISARIWHSTLDGRTTAVCQARDGLAAPVGNNPLPKGLKELSPPNATPPAHMNCRSIMVAYIDGAGLVGQRPYVVDKRTRNNREIDFRKEAQRTGRPIQEIRADWAEKHIGRVPASTNYQDFLSRQPAAFQDEVLGPTRGRLFRSGGLTVQNFVDRSGNELTLAQLAETKPEAFIKAGLDPSIF